MKGIYLAFVLFLSLLLSQYVLFERRSATQAPGNLIPDAVIQEAQKEVLKIYEDEHILVLKNGEAYVVIRKDLNT